jgi:hypothetical protein
MTDINEWLSSQVGRSRGEVLIAARALAAETKNAVKQSQKGGRAQRSGVTMQMRAAVSAASKADSRARCFLKFVTELMKRPAGVTATDWALYGDIVQGWRGDGNVPKRVFELFDN